MKKRNKKYNPNKPAINPVRKFQLIDEALEDLEYPTAPWDETIASAVKALRGES